MLLHRPLKKEQRVMAALLQNNCGSDAASGLLDSAPFYAQLTRSLVLIRGTGDITFTRATTATVENNDGYLVQAISGEARFTGARRVMNLLTYTEDFSNAAWVASNVTKAAGELLATAANGTALHSYTAVAGDYVFSVDLKRKTGTGNIQIAADSGTYTTVTLTADWQTFNVKQTVAAGAKTAGIKIVTDTDAVYVRKAQLENVTSQTTQTVGEYVSVGVLSAPFHGAGVDGVKYFDTDISGNPIAVSVLKGLLIEEARTNSILQSQTLGTTWTISNAADMEAVAADAYGALDGTTTMDKLQPKATTAVHSLDQAFTFTAARYTTSAYFRYVSATPQRWVALVCNDGTTTWAASFDLLNGVVGAVSAAGGGFGAATSTIEATATAGVYRCSMTNTANAAAAAGTVKISLNNSDSATLESAIRAGTETLGVWGLQHEVGATPSSYIPTTTTALTRAADVCSMTGTNFSSWFNATEGTFVVRATGVNNVSGATRRYLEISDGTASNRYAIGYAATNATRFLDTIANVVVADISVTTPSGGVAVTMAAAYKANDHVQASNGILGTTDTVSAVPGVSQMNLGWDAGGTANGNLNGHISSITYYNRRLSNSQLQAITK